MQDRYLGKMNRVADDITVRRNIWRRATTRLGRAAVRVTFADVRAAEGMGREKL